MMSKNDDMYSVPTFSQEGMLVGFRPVVCLKSDVILETNDNGQTYYYKVNK